MPLDAVMLTALRRELEKELSCAKIDRIGMPERDLLILSVRSRQSGNRKLLISLRPGSARIHLTEQSFENPAQPPMFCMLLRKHLLGARITGFEQPEGERLLILTLDASDELNYHAEKKLYLELMGKSVNLILVDTEGRVVDCFRRQEPSDSARRALLPGLFYALPQSQPKPSFFRTDAETFADMARRAPRDEAPDKWLLDTFGGLSPALCRELALAGWEGVEAQADRLRAVVQSGDLRPVMLLEDGVPKDYFFMPMRQYGAFEQTEYPTFSALLDDFYARRDRQENMRRRAAELSRTATTALSRLRRKTAAREQELLATEKREDYRRRGDLITANIYRLSRGMDSFEAVDYYDESCPTVTVALDPRKTPQQNAAASYKLYNKAKTANRVLTELIAEAREEESYLESVLHELALAGNEADLAAIRSELTSTGYLRQKTGAKRSKKLPQREPLRFTSPTGAEILVGRSNVQNDELTFRIAHRGDLWLHVQKLPGSHVIVLQREGEADEESVRFAADLAAAFSSAADGERVAVDCTLVRNVKKPAGAKPGRVVYSDYKTLVGRCDHKRYRS
ncbi:MAG: NFACT RNA binding domain-containing protein [Eubacteriales bacterium]|nr:NFACT RNA binding domain-containing protein [Eubacteriales bacterium]